ncbi:MAG: ABC-type sugar transport system periplasmic component-like protein [Actinomycetia bacterium]|nr:ABC-type sugar transport system periplasmic component-like protein [Actinomycetes bacterium]
MRSALVLAATTVAALVFTLAAWPAAQSGSGVAAVKPVPGRTQPVANTTGKPVKIALISFPESNEFFNPVKKGSDKANAVLQGRNASVDYITVNDFTQDAVNAATRAALLKGYDAVGIVALDAGVCPVIKDAVAKSIKVATFIVSDTCVQKSGALFFHGEDLYKSWKTISTPALVNAVNSDPYWKGKKCKVGVITGAFAVPAHELMRKGILDGLKGTNLSPVSGGVEIAQDLSKVGPAVRAYITGSPTDLCGIIIDIGDAGAGAAALTAAQAKHIKVVSADLTVGGVAQMKKGKQTVLIGQDPFGESYDTAMLLYNAVVTGKNPGFYQPVKDSVMTRKNLDALMKAQASGAVPK